MVLTPAAGRRSVDCTSLAPLCCALLALLALLGCGDGPSGAARTTMVSLWLETTSRDVRVTADTLDLNATLLVRGRARLSTDAVVDTSGTWESSDTGVVAVASSGRAATLVARRAGRATVTLRAGELQASLALTVVRTPVMYVEIERGDQHQYAQSPDSLLVGTSMQYHALAMGPGGRHYDDAVVTWTSSDTSVVTIGGTGAVQARRLGRAMITAESEGQHQQVAIVVRPPLAARIAFTYAPDTLLARRTDSVRVVLLDSAGRPMDVPAKVQVTGSPASYDPATRTVLGNEATGTTELVASGDGLSARRSLVVLPVPVARIDVSPGTLTMEQATSARLRVVVRDLDDRRVARIVSFASGDPAIATVGADGTVRAITTGHTTMRVRADTATTVLPVDVVASSAFTIDVRWADFADAAAVNVTKVAAQALQHAVLGDLPDIRVTLPADACGRGFPAEEIFVDDLVVHARHDVIDGAGGIVAMAGPCVVREDGSTVIGEMMIDRDDLAMLRGDSQFAALIQHELLHVLGFGTTWGRDRTSLVVERAGQYRFMGPRARRVAASWGREQDGGGVALGGADQPGDGHWSEGVFTTELMTPYLDADANVLSLLTLEALSDIGYVTGAAAAQPFAAEAFVNGSLAAARAPLTSMAPRGNALPLREHALRPRWRVDRSGRVQRIAR